MDSTFDIKPANKWDIVGYGADGPTPRERLQCRGSAPSPAGASGPSTPLIMLVTRHPPASLSRNANIEHDSDVELAVAYSHAYEAEPVDPTWSTASSVSACDGAIIARYEQN